jgi:hypothetical protein
VDGDLEGGVLGEHVLQPRAVGGDLGEARDRLALLGGEGGEQLRREVARGIPARVARLGADEHRAVGAVQPGPGEGEHGGDRDLAGRAVRDVLVADGDGGRGGREDLANGDPVGLVRQAPERTALERSRCGALPASVGALSS